MNILILGGGGREHALAWAVMQNPKCDKLIVAPGNAGIAQIAECAALDTEDGGAVTEFAGEHAIDLVIVGPEAPLAAGVADRLREAGFLVFGPSQAAAELEASKSFTKAICDAANAPTAAYGHFTDAEAAKGALPELAGAVWEAAETLRETTEWLVAQPMAERFGTAVPYLRAFARVLGGHYHLRAAMADPDGAHGRIARYYITRLLPEHAGLLGHVRAGEAELMEISPDDLAA